MKLLCAGIYVAGRIGVSKTILAHQKLVKPIEYAYRLSGAENNYLELYSQSDFANGKATQLNTSSGLT